MRQHLTGQHHSISGPNKSSFLCVNSTIVAYINGEYRQFFLSLVLISTEHSLMMTMSCFTGKFNSLAVINMSS